MVFEKLIPVFLLLTNCKNVSSVFSEFIFDINFLFKSLISNAVFMILLAAISFFLDSELHANSSINDKIIKKKYFIISG